MQEQSGTHASFLGLDIKTKDWIFAYILFGKRDNFFIVSMPDFQSNIPSTIFYGYIYIYI